MDRVDRIVSTRNIRSFLVAREGIESPPYLEEFKDIFETLQKVTLKSNPEKEWLLVDVLGHSPHKAVRRFAALASRPDIR
jgi:hypothetical protein